MHYTELFREGELYSMIQQGYVSVRDHLEYPLRIYNYTDKAQYDQVWNSVTTNCRGLIVDYDGNIVARGFPKFFNYGQPGAAEIDLRDYVEVTDKMDGSLGIMYQTPGGYAIATRGSFHSDQASHATLLFNLLYGDFEVEPGWTPLFEIIYPDNRIVLDYGSMNDLVLLGVVNNRTGDSHGPYNSITDHWTGPRAKHLGLMTFAEALDLPQRKNSEGVVIRNLASGKGGLLKIKQESYVELHRLIFSLNENRVWEALSGNRFDEMITGLPDEFHQWVKDMAAPMREQFIKIKQLCYNEYTLIVQQLDAEYTRKDFALRAKTMTHPGILFAIEDNRDVDSMIWKLVKQCRTPQEIAT